MTGWDILEFIRDRDDLDDLAIIMLTGRADADDVDRAAEMGADAYLLKPFRPAELRRVVIDTIRGASTAAV
jgi:DNA-binding response OmpR family regulator